MELTADHTLDYYIKKKTDESKWGFLGCILIFLFISAAFYYNITNRVVVGFNIVLIAIFIGFMIKSIVGREATNINSIVQSIVITDKIIVYTYRYKFLFYIKQPRVLQIDKSQLKSEEVSFPYNDEGLKDIRTKILKIGEQKYYILYGNFPDELEHWIN